MNFPDKKLAPTSALAGDASAAADVSKLLAPVSPTGARFFIRADGQYFVSTQIIQDEDWRIGGETMMRSHTAKIRNGVLGFKPNGEGEIFLMDEFFLN